MDVRTFAPHLLGLALALAACSSTSAETAGSAGQTGSGGGATGATGGAGGSGGAGGEDIPDSGTPDAPADLCDAPPESACGVESSWVRGVAHFDPAHFAPGAAPVLRVALRHPFALIAGEEAIGGRLHANVNVPVDDVAAGQVAFAIDMCMYGAAMWSEENGTFHLVAILDENGNNDLNKATSNQDAITKATADAGELVTMADVDVSCHAASPCLDVTLDCADGTGCTTIVPLTSCAKKTPGCASDAELCN